MKKNDFNALIISGNPTEKDLQESWDRTRQEQIDEFGINESLKRYLELKQMHVMALCDLGLDNSPINVTYEEMAANNLKNFELENEGYKFSDLLTGVEKFMSFPIDLNTVTVYDFYRRATAFAKQLKDGRKGD